MADAPHGSIPAVIKVGGNIVAGLKNVKFALNGKQIDVTNKSHTQWSESLGGRASWTMDGDGFLYLNVTDGTMEAQWKALWTAVSTSASVTVHYILPTKTTSPWRSWFTGTAFVSGLNMDGPDDEGFLGSFTLNGTGAVSIAELS